MNPSQRPQFFQWLYERHFRLVWSVVGQLGMAGPAREDAVQEIWLTVYRRLDTLDPEASSKAWVCSIARKVVWRLRRNAQRRDRRASAYAAEPVRSATCAARRVEVTAEIDEALAALSEEQRAVLVMANVHGLTAPEISTTLDLPVNTVYSRLRLARRRLESIAADEPDVRRALESTDQPPERLRGYVWALLQPAIAKPAVLVAASGWGTAKAIAVGMALGGAAVAGLVLPTHLPTGAPPQESPPAVVRPAAKLAAADPKPRVKPAPSSMLAVAPDLAPQLVPEPLAAPAVVGADPTPPSPPAKPRGRAAAPAPPAPASVPAQAPAQDAAPDVAAEAKLLRRAQDKLRTGASADALRLLKQHEQTFEGGALADVRDGAMVRALCSLGRAEQAARIARRLKSASPGSPVATAVEAGTSQPCEEHGKTSGGLKISENLAGDDGSAAAGR